MAALVGCVAEASSGGGTVASVEDGVRVEASVAASADGKSGTETATSEQPSETQKKSKKEAVPEYVFTYAENQTSDYPTTAAARYFSELVSERTNGRIVIRVYPNAELGDERSTVQQISFGGIDFGRASLSNLADCSPESVVLQMPYLYKDAHHMWQVLDGDIGKEMMASFQGTGLVALTWFDAGARNFYTKTPVRTVSDMKGMKIRVQQSALMEDVVRSLGAEPVPLIYEDVYSALETGEIDGAENNWSSYEAMKHYEYAKYFTLDEHTRVPELVLMSQATWDVLSDDDRNVIESCAEEAAEYEKALWNKRRDQSRARVISAGTEVITLSGEEKANFRAAVSPLYEKYCGDYISLVDQIEAVENE